MPRQPGWNKYSAKTTEIDGIRFASKREAIRYAELKLLLRAGQISGLKLQPRYPLCAGDVPILLRSGRYRNGRQLVYVADFEYVDQAGVTVTEDAKGYETPEWKIKRALFEIQYGRQVVTM